MPGDQPNVLLVTTDQQRYDTIGPAAPDFLRTPHVDMLRRQGMTFTTAYSSCPLCVPSRTSIMTGRTAFSHGMAHNGKTSAAMGREGTLPARLRDLGYATAAIGKMHFDPPRNRHGFDEMLLPSDYYRERRRSGRDRQPMRHGLGQNELYPTRATVPETATLTSWIAERCVDYVRERRDPTVPFFLWCSFSKPHPPLDPPEPYYSMYRDCDVPAPVYGDWSAPDRCPEPIKRRPWMGYDVDFADVVPEARAAYYGLVTQVDYNLGRVLAALNETGLLDDTLILYASDHGEYLGDHGLTNKTFFHEASAHVPFVVRLPQSWGDRRAGATVDDPVQLADVLPTLVSAAGGEPPADADGQDAVALGRGELDDPREYAVATSATVSECDYLGITDGRWKYIWYPLGGTEQLFDLDADAGETTDLAGDPETRDRRRDLRETMVRRVEDRGSPFVADGDLVTIDPADVPFEDPRDVAWEGFFTDYYEETDIRH